MNEWILVVDDDANNLKAASHILVKNGMRASCVRSGEDALRFLDGGRRPDLILLDIHMPEMDGFETLRRIRADAQTAAIPVVFLTADEGSDAETRGLEAGAMDFIKKPFVPEVLLTRVCHMINLDRLQRNLEAEVEKKTKENEGLFLHVVSSLASAIDAKDTYTNGHSDRVASYAWEIARRAGYEGKKLEDIYMMGLLHDVGKIGIPDAVINKPAKLTDEEYAIIKNHPVMGARILGEIREMPSLANGARWHHERYDGRGYPDGLSGEVIPEEARIIAVADAYDAMTSHRSYREPLPQGVVRQEIEKGRGTQFDPAFASIMLEMIEEDTEYAMREK